jgi:aspartate/methionine/tyrosine aminotransferase
VREACIQAIRGGKNSYSLTQGAPVLREKLQAQIDAEYGHADRKVFVSSGTSGGLVLAMLSLVDPGDEVIIFDPYFVMYEPLVSLVGGRAVLIDTYPDFRIDVERVADAVTPRTKLILLNSPANPTGVTATHDEIRGLADLAAQRNIALLSDEIYRAFLYDGPFDSPARYNDQTIVIDGFSKSHAMTGWRVGFAHGPSAVIDTMVKLQQYSFVCAPHPAQWAAASAMDVDVQDYVDAYRRKRDLMYEGLSDLYEIVKPGGAFYAFPQSALGNGHRVRHRSDPQQSADHSGRHLQPPRYPFSPLVRCRRFRDRSRNRSPAETGSRTGNCGFSWDTPSWPRPAITASRGGSRFLPAASTSTPTSKAG